MKKIDERIVTALSETTVAVPPLRLAAAMGIPLEDSNHVVAGLTERGLVAATPNGSLYATLPGRAHVRQMALDAQMQDLIDAQADAIVASATDILDESNSGKMLALLGRSSSPMSRQLLATTLGEDAATIAALADSLIADGLIEATPADAYSATSKGRDRVVDMTDAEMQDMFQSDVDALVASSAALMSVDPADVAFHEAMEMDAALMTVDPADVAVYEALERDQGLIASAFGEPIDGWDRPLTREEATVTRAIVAAKSAQAAHTAQRTPDTMRRMLTALQILNESLSAFAAAGVLAPYVQRHRCNPTYQTKEL